MPNYSNGKIYTIRFHNSNEIYIGSTIQPLAVRFGGHKRGKKTSLYHLINNKYNSDWSVCYYELYENYSCNNKEELFKKEGELIRLFKNDENYECINNKIIGRTRNEYYIENIDKINEKKKIYNENNKEIIADKNKEWRENNKKVIIEKKKEYYEKNKEIIAEKGKIKYYENKEVINEKRKEKITCECGCVYRKNDLSKHLKTKKHIDLMSQKSYPNISSIITDISTGAVLETILI